jgi:hypothetical protein
MATHQSPALPPQNPRITVSKFKHAYNQPSVIAKIPGTTGSVGIFLYPSIDLYNIVQSWYPRTSTPSTEQTPASVPRVPTTMAAAL